MCQDNLEVTIKIPIGCVDKNGNIYPKDSVEKAIERFKQDGEIPLIVRESGIQLGVVNDITLEDYNMVIHGVLDRGGTIEFACLTPRTENRSVEVFDMRFTHVSLVPRQFIGDNIFLPKD